MAADTVWKPAHDANIKWATVDLPCMSVEYNHTADEFETSNTVGNGDHEFGIGGRTRSLRWDYPVSTTGVCPLEEDLLACIYSDGLFTYTGTARIVSSSRKGGGKGGYVISYEAKFTGAVAKAAVV